MDDCVCTYMHFYVNPPIPEEQVHVAIKVSQESFIGEDFSIYPE